MSKGLSLFVQRLRLALDGPLRQRDCIFALPSVCAPIPSCRYQLSEDTVGSDSKLLGTHVLFMSCFVYEETLSPHSPVDPFVTCLSSSDVNKTQVAMPMPFRKVFRGSIRRLYPPIDVESHLI
jgi:hypothetical protein